MSRGESVRLGVVSKTDGSARAIPPTMPFGAVCLALALTFSLDCAVARSQHAGFPPTDAGDRGFVGASITASELVSTDTSAPCLDIDGSPRQSSDAPVGQPGGGESYPSPDDPVAGFVLGLAVLVLGTALIATLVALHRRSISVRKLRLSGDRLRCSMASWLRMPRPAS